MSFGSEFATGFAQGFQMMSNARDKKEDRAFRERTQTWREKVTKENQDIERQKHFLKTDADLEAERRIREGTGAIPNRASTDTPGSTGGTPELEAARQAITSNESGGNYQILGPTQRNGNYAIGRYQVMASNVPQWTRMALGKSMTPAEFRASPEAQDKVFDHVFGGYMKKYGPSGAARAWFGGEGRVHTGDQIKDSLGTTIAAYQRKFDKAYAGILGKTPGGQIAAATVPVAATPTQAPAPMLGPRAPGVAPGDTTGTQAGSGDLDAIIANPANEDQRQWAIREKARLYGQTEAAPVAMANPDPMANDDDDDEESAMARGGAIPPRRKFASGGITDYFQRGVSGQPFAPGAVGAGTAGGASFAPRKVGQAPMDFGPQAPPAPPYNQPQKPKETKPKGTSLMQGPGKGPYSWSPESRFEEKVPTVQGWGANSLKGLTNEQLQSWLQRSSTTPNDPRGMFASGFGPASWAFGVGTKMDPEQSKQMTDYARYRVGEMGVHNATSLADQERAQSAIYQAQRQPQGDRSGPQYSGRAEGGPIEEDMGPPAIPPRRRKKVAKYAAGGATKKKPAVDKDTGLPAADYDIEDFEAPTLQPNISKGGRAYGGPYSIPRQEDIGWGVDMVTPAQARSRERRAELAAFRADQPEDTGVAGQMTVPMTGLTGMGPMGMGQSMGGMGGMGMMGGLQGVGPGQPAPGAGSTVGYRQFAAGGPADPIYGTNTGVMQAPNPEYNEPKTPWVPNKVGDVPQEYGPHPPPAPKFEPAKPKAAPAPSTGLEYMGEHAAGPSATGGAYGLPASSYGGPVYKNEAGALFSDEEGKYAIPASAGLHYAEGGGVGGGIGGGLGKAFDWHNYQVQPPEFYRAGPGGSEAQHGQVEQENYRVRTPPSPGGSSTNPTPGQEGASPGDPGLRRPYENPKESRTKDDDVRLEPPPAPKAQKSKGRRKEEGEQVAMKAAPRDVTSTGSIETKQGPSRGFELEIAGEEDGGFDMVDEDYTRPMLTKATGLKRGGAIPSRYEGGGQVQDEVSEANAARQRITQRQAARAGLTQGDLNRARSDPSRYGPYFGGGEETAAPRKKTQPKKPGPGKPGPGPGKPTPPEPTKEPFVPPTPPHTPTPPTAYPAAPDTGSRPNEMGDQTGPYPEVQYAPYSGSMPSLPEPQEPGIAPQQLGPPAAAPLPDMGGGAGDPRRARQYDPGPNPVPPTRQFQGPAIPPRAGMDPGPTGGPGRGWQRGDPSGGAGDPRTAVVQPARPPFNAGPSPVPPTRQTQGPPAPSRPMVNVPPAPFTRSPGTQIANPLSPRPMSGAPQQPQVRPPNIGAPAPRGFVYITLPNGQVTMVPEAEAARFMQGQSQPAPAMAGGGMVPHYADGGPYPSGGGPFMMENPPFQEPAIPPRGSSPPPFAEPAPAAPPVAGSPEAQGQPQAQPQPPAPKLPREQQDAIVNPNGEPNPAARSIKLGLDFANDRVRQFIDGTSGSGIPGQQNPELMNAMQAIAAGERVGDIETMTPSEVKEVYAAVDPKDELDVAQKHIKAYQDIHDYYIAQGNPLQAARTSMALTLYSKQYVQKAGAMAGAALKAGDVQTAMGWLDKAFDRIPDNQDLTYEIGPGGQVNFKIMNRATGKLSQGGIATPDMIANVAMQLQTGVAFDEQMAASIREVGAWTGHTQAQGGGRQPREGDLKREDNRAVNAAIQRGIQAGHDGDMKGLMAAQQEIFERLGQGAEAVAAATRMYEDAGVEPPPSLKAYGPKRTGEGEGGTLTERDRKERAAKTKEYRAGITAAEQTKDPIKIGAAHVDYADFMYQNQKEDPSIDKNSVVEGMPTDVKDGSPEYNTIQSGAYQILRKNPIHAAQAVEFMRAAMNATPADVRYTEDGRVQIRGLSQPLFLSRDLLREIERWKVATKEAA